jgi:hypothetical protein
MPAAAPQDDSVKKPLSTLFRFNGDGRATPKVCMDASEGGSVDAGNRPLTIGHRREFGAQRLPNSFAGGHAIGGFLFLRSPRPASPLYSPSPGGPACSP